MHDSVIDITEIREHFDRKEEIREELLDISHRSIRKSSRAMTALHRGDEEEVANLLEEIKKDVKKLNELLESEPRFSDHGALIAANREYAEVVLTKTLIEDGDLPGVGDLQVSPQAYVQALAEAIGELRRHFLNLLRKDEVDESREIHEKMERIFETLEQLDYPDSILSGIKHRRDVARKTLEKTREDMTRAIRERGLEEALGETQSRLEE
ncbi:hypothetical protein AKJ65_00165 [candidate division MSBL1 archaeon SCGC-AAA259E19]|uniref:Haloacid dehalogenase n=1 Tax=candidate division MSBL1 archaeon SCGC-AAA259E19 TaxID=1698264 RepID=A0A133UNY1_9EURY|nr:hypothetical protein AKJ65_00165 [candidate division MSBL1 archaeon SCGC-AAA259E19]